VITSVVAGLVIGVILGSLGGGGAILSLPVLVFALGLAPHDAASASLVIVGITSAIALVEHARAGRVHWRDGLVFGVVGAVGTFFGTTLARRIDGATRSCSPSPACSSSSSRSSSGAAPPLAPDSHRTSVVRRPSGSLARPTEAATTMGAATAVGLLTGLLRGRGRLRRRARPRASPSSLHDARGRRHLPARAHPQHLRAPSSARAITEHGLADRLVGHRRPSPSRRDRRQLPGCDRLGPRRAPTDAPPARLRRSSSSASPSYTAVRSRWPDRSAIIACATLDHVLREAPPAPRRPPPARPRDRVARHLPKSGAPPRRAGHRRRRARRRLRGLPHARDGRAAQRANARPRPAGGRAPTPDPHSTSEAAPARRFGSSPTAGPALRRPSSTPRPRRSHWVRRSRGSADSTRGGNVGASARTSRFRAPT
jgi:hypothetical protein